MKNGVNIGAFSELAREVCTDEKEARLRFSASAHPLLHDVAIDVRTIRAGTIRVARDFYFEIAGRSDERNGVPTSLETLLISLGGCVMFTWVQGCSVKGITLQKLRIALRAKPAADRSGALQAVGYDVFIDSDGSPEQLVAIAKNVTCFSPMHRTFLEATDLQLRVARTEQPPAAGRRRASRSLRSDAPPGVARGAELSVALDWHYGSHFEAYVGSERRGSVLNLDQPKQVGGLERGPNAQEYMMGVLGSELLRASTVSEVPVAGVCARCCVDLRGCLNTGQTDLVRVHDIHVDVEPLGRMTQEDEARLRKAFEATAVVQTIATPVPIDIAVHRGKERIFEQRSDMATVQEWMSRLSPMEMF